MRGVYIPKFSKIVVFSVFWVLYASVYTYSVKYGTEEWTLSV